MAALSISTDMAIRASRGHRFLLVAAYNSGHLFSTWEFECCVQGGVGKAENHKLMDSVASCSLAAPLHFGVKAQEAWIAARGHSAGKTNPKGGISDVPDALDPFPRSLWIVNLRTRF